MAANVFRRIVFALAALALSACDRGPELPESAGYGPNPTLPEPHPTGAFPYVNIARAVGWPSAAKPTAAEGLGVVAFAAGLDHPRWLYQLPNGDILVAETDAPAPSEDAGGGGVRGFFMNLFMRQAGSNKPSANRITLLRDADGDGVAEMKEVFLENLNSPFGMALIGDQLYVANADSLVRFPYKEGDTRIEAPPEKVVDLPSGRNLHWTKSLVADPMGSRLYVGVGSNSNVAENGMDEEHNRAAVLEINPETGETRVFASGLRNPVGMDWNPATGDLWVAVNERDELGDNLVPDYMTSVREGAFYGWPYSYYGQHVDERVQPQNPELVMQAIRPDYGLGSHTGSLGLTFVGDADLGPFQNGAIIGQHGSWNRSPRVGYRVIFVEFHKGAPVGGPKEVLTGFLNESGEAQGRPVGVIIDKRGGLLVADDVGGVVWRVSAAKKDAE